MGRIDALERLVEFCADLSILRYLPDAPVSSSRQLDMLSST
jgi:hypothetical protein